MKNQWDEIATINPFYGVDAISDFQEPDIDKDLFWQRGKEAVDQFLTELKLGDVSTWEMVEIGCGLGRMTHRFSQYFSRVYAFDISPVMLEKARSYWNELSNVEFILGTGVDLKPVKNHSIDFVFSFIVLQHVLSEDIVINYIKECGRVLKPGKMAFLQLRTYTPETSMTESHFKQALFFPWRRYIKPIIKATRNIHIPNKNNANKLIPEYQVWHGCRVNTHAVEDISKHAGLNIMNIRGLNTQYTFYPFQKKR